MKRLFSTFAVLLVASQGQIALAKRCPDGKYRAVCAAVGSTPSNRPTFLPNPSDYVGHEAEYRADLADFRQQIALEQKNGTISKSEYDMKLHAQMNAQKALSNVKAR